MTKNSSNLDKPLRAMIQTHMFQKFTSIKAKNTQKKTPGWMQKMSQ